MDNVTMSRRDLTAMIAARGTQQVSNTTGGARNANRNAVTAQKTQSFADILSGAASAKAVEPLKISKHAESRLRDRNIDLSDGQREKIVKALEKAESKGVRETLVMLDGFALVANAASRTVITAVGESDLKQNIFTNIDGAVFA